MKKITFMLLVGTVLLLAGCRSKKDVIDTPTDPAALAAADPVTRVNINRIQATGIRSKINLRLESGSGHVSVSGKMQMVRDDVIHISITPHGLFEIGVLELTPEYLLVVDRWHKQYFRAKWKDIKSLHSAGVDFYAFQALFWEELYVPGQKSLPTASEFTVSDQGQTMRLSPRTRGDVNFDFLAQALNGLITQTAVTTPQQSDLRLEWNYSEWTSLGRQQYPGRMVVGIGVSKRRYSATFSFSRPTVDNDMKDVRTKLDTSRYSAVEFDYIINLLTNA